VTTTQTYSSGNIITIIRELAIKQEIDYVENDPFPAETHEEGLDRACMIDQQLAEELRRTIKFKKSSSYQDIELDDPEAGRVLIWNQTADGIENGPTADQIENAQSHAQDAATSANNAAQSETKARRWAEEDEDVEVEPGQYSAKHHASKARAWAKQANAKLMAIIFS